MPLRSEPAMPASDARPCQNRPCRAMPAMPIPIHASARALLYQVDATLCPAPSMPSRAKTTTRGSAHAEARQTRMSVRLAYPSLQDHLERRRKCLWRWTQPLTRHSMYYMGNALNTSFVGIVWVMLGTLAPSELTRKVSAEHVLVKRGLLVDADTDPA